MEILNIYHENYELKGKLSRSEVHYKEEWHETFQCIFTCGDKVILQKRSKYVSDYKGLLDVTIGGHIKSDETMAAGVREIKEELGIDILFDDLKLVCVIPEILDIRGKMDKEFINVFIYEVSEEELKQITFNDNEVEHLIEVPLKELKLLFFNSKHQIKGKNVLGDNEITFGKNHFLPYSEKYFNIIGSVL
ncbi:NUDIX hydrolase [Macrococcus animalis]|uniref:NUDIX hydrolase n=1 Tax=Macrococcus animalis TaxID=3395467 RepID=UPI0039BEC700